MTKQMKNVLDALTYFGGSASESMLADRAGCPRPSVRRAIQQLQDEGHHISYAGSNGCYVLERSVA